MKTDIRTILFIPVMMGLVLSSCLDDKQEELKFMGGWKLDHYYEGGNDITIEYLQGHKEHMIYLETNFLFSERWGENDSPDIVYGSWHLADKRDEIVLHDQVNGDRKYKLKYTYYLSHKQGDREYVFRKL